MTKTRPFIVYWNNIPSPYMVARFNALVERNEIEFEAWFNEGFAFYNAHGELKGIDFEKEE